MGRAVCSAGTCVITRACPGAGSLPRAPRPSADKSLRAVCRLSARLQRQRRLLRLRPRRWTRACRGALCTLWHPGQGCSPVEPSLCTSSRWDAGCITSTCRLACMCFIVRQGFCCSIGLPGCLRAISCLSDSQLSCRPQIVSHAQVASTIRSAVSEGQFQARMGLKAPRPNLIHIVTS